ncbi:hypothetical protein B9Z19DRAFT_1124336 [Tuber borchii]|uniref:Uncharacterized protein n=1 Tax=Tuber borchii TaxID=42251 RepID=A0A2T6ZWX7_TUBBO|nr:hypothetical protein B9Z19DRAFT_1124336 [Tuber borchii]
MATTSIAEASTEEFPTWTFGPDHSITLHTIYFGQMKADFFFYKPWANCQSPQIGQLYELKLCGFEWANISKKKICHLCSTQNMSYFYQYLIDILHYQVVCYELKFLNFKNSINIVFFSQTNGIFNIAIIGLTMCQNVKLNDMRHRGQAVFLLMNDGGKAVIFVRGGRIAGMLELRIRESRAIIQALELGYEIKGRVSSLKVFLHEPDIIPLPCLRPAANVLVDHCFFETKGFPQSSLDNYSDPQPSLFSHPYLYLLSWGHKVIRFFYMMDFAKAGMHTTVLGQMYWLGVKIHEDKSENVEPLQNEMVSGFLDSDNAEYKGILAALGAGI